MPVIHDRMPSGIPGDVSRKAGATIEPVIAAAAIAYGSPVQLNTAGKLTGPVAAGSSVYGFLVRPYPAQSASLSEDAPGASGSVRANEVADVLRSGYMTVRLSTAEGTAPVKGTPVKVVFAATGDFAVGDIAVSQGVAVPGCFFMGGADASKNVEIAFNI